MILPLGAISDTIREIDQHDVLRTRLERTIEWIVGLLLVFMPLALGAVYAWSETVVLLAVGLAALCLAARLIGCRDTRFVWTWAFLPMGLFILLALAQLIPLPAAGVGWLSPQTLATRNRLLADLPDADQLLKLMTLSFYPPGTRQILRVVLAASLLFVIVPNIYQRPGQIRRLLMIIAFTGGAMALLALAQDLAGATAIFWQIERGRPVTAGPFVNYNNFAQFMNLSMGAALALLLMQLGQSGARHRSAGDSIRRFFEPENWLAQAMAAVIILGAASIFLSGSRAGMISFLAAFALAGLLMASRRDTSARGWFIVTLGLGVFLVVLYLAFDIAYDRLATLHNLEDASGGRWQINRDVWSLMRPLYPVFGIGLGSHEVVYPMFSRLNDASLAAHVENEYVQMIEEMGFAGLALVGIFLAAIVGLFVRALRRGRLPIHMAMPGIAFGLTAVLIHSVSDFGQRLPANACLSAIFCGLLVSLHRLARPKGGPTSNVPSPASAARLIPIAGLFILVTACGWAGVGGIRAAAAESHWARALAVEKRLEKEGWQGADQDYAELIAHAAAASAAEPDRIEYRHWLNVYRLQEINRNLDPQTGSVLLTPKSLESIRQITDAFHAARALCPTYGPTYCIAGQLELSFLGNPRGAELIRTGYVLYPTHPTTCFVVGQLEAQEGRFEDSLNHFRRSILLGHPIAEPLAIYVNDLDRPDLAMQLAQDNSAGLLALAALLEAKPQHAELAAAAREQAIGLLRAEADRPTASPQTLATLAGLLVRRQDHSAAVAYYQRALDLDYGNVYWRLSLAQALAATGQIPQAIHEARICLRLRPQLAAAERLIADLSVRPAVKATKGKASAGGGGIPADRNADGN